MKTDNGYAVRDTMAAETLDRVPPQSIEAEQSVLGSLLLDNHAFDDVVPLLTPEHFYRDSHQKLYRAMRELYEHGGRVDALILHEHLKKRGLLEDVGGAAYLGDILQSVPHAANAGYYARIVRDKSDTRDLIGACAGVLSRAYDEQDATDDLLEEAERQLFAILERREGTDSIAVADVLKAAFERIEVRLHRGQGHAAALGTGFVDLDNLTGGFQDGELVILAARPGMGKTSLGLDVAAHVALVDAAAVLVVSLEQSRLEVGERLLCAHSGIDSHRLRNGYLSALDQRRLVESSGALSAAPIFIDDSPSRNMMQVGAMARRLRRKANLRLVVIDYLQLIDPEKSRDNRQEQIAGIARRLKRLARELNIPVLAMAQLNRQVESREGNLPRLSDLRESGAIEQDADVVMFLHRHEQYKPGERLGEADLIVAKNRNGPTGRIKLVFQKTSMRFKPSAEGVPWGVEIA